MATTTPAVDIGPPLMNSIPESLLPKFDPKFVELYNKYNVGRPNTHQIPIEDYRANPSKYIISYGRQTVNPGNLRITEQKCIVENGEIPIRICEPEPPADAKPRPAYMNFHGGGWVFGDLETGHNFCKRVAIELDCVTFDVGYRLAPENPFPIPVDDSWTALKWMREKQTEFNLDLNKIAIGGCSAGGQIAAVLAHMCRDSNIPIALQLLAVPVTDLHSFTPTGQVKEDCPYESYRALADTVPLSAARMGWFHNQFLGNPRSQELDNNWKVSPICAPNFGGLAPALIVTAEMDVLRDEGKAYGEKMIKFGSKAEIICVRGAPHSFSTMDEALEIGKQYNREALRGLGEAFGITAKSLQ